MDDIPRHAVGKDLLHGADLPQGASQGQTIPGINGPIGDLGTKTLDIVDLVQMVPELRAQDRVLVQLLHRILPRLDGGKGLQRAIDPVVEHPTAHGGLRDVQQVQQGVLPTHTGPDPLRELQVAPGVDVQLHIFRTADHHNAADMIEPVLLSILQILHEPAGGTDCQWQIGAAEAVQAGYVEVFFQHLRSPAELEHAVRLFLKIAKVLYPLF